MNKEFRQAIAVLKQTNEDFSKGYKSAVAHAATREAAILAAVRYMAKSFGVTLEPMHAIDARGEIHIATEGAAFGHGRFGSQFADLLTKARARTGVAPGTVSADHNWCYVNHFEAERMVLDFFESAA